MSEIQYRLVVKSGGVIGTAYALETTEIYLGRDAQNDIVVPEADVSRRHARLRRQGSVFIIEDLGSTNGTFINGKRLVAPYTLRAGDEVQLGPNVVFIFEQVSDPEATVAVNAQTIRAAVEPQPTPPPLPEAAPPPPAAAPRPAPAPPQAVPPPQAKKSGISWLLILIALVLLACVVIAGVLWYIDVNRLWCTVFPFLFPGACP